MNNVYCGLGFCILRCGDMYLRRASNRDEHKFRLVIAMPSSTPHIAKVGKDEIVMLH